VVTVAAAALTVHPLLVGHSNHRPFVLPAVVVVVPTVVAVVVVAVVHLLLLGHSRHRPFPPLLALLLRLQKQDSCR